MDANEVLRRYAVGERNFRQADWRGISLEDSKLEWGRFDWGTFEQRRFEKL